MPLFDAFPTFPSAVSAVEPSGAVSGELTEGQRTKDDLGTMKPVNKTFLFFPACLGSDVNILFQDEGVLK
ncbi:hypothetical protein [Leisingera sp.]|uniref:hypothetical protein n=1 Tax=Leisingera sp. TaxID=1879318 RepID=UPI003A91D776